MVRTSTQVRYVLDARPAMTHSTGVGNYVCGLAKGFARLTGTQPSALPSQPTTDQDRSAIPSEELLLFTSSWSEQPGAELRALAQARSVRLEHVRFPVRVLNFLWHYLHQPTIERLVGSVAVAHSPHPLLLPAARAAQIVTVHDLYFLEHREQTFSEVRRDYGKLLWRSLDRAQAILCVSNATRADLLEKAEAREDQARQALQALEAKIHVTANGVDFEFFHQNRGAQADPKSEPLPAGLSDSGFLLAVGRIEPRKNPERILEALACEPLHNKRLLWAGMPADAATEKWFAECLKRHRLEHRVEVLGFIDRDHLRTLYQQAEALVFPSLNEGFGLPILEAMASGCPVVTSNTTAMPEVAGNAAVLVDPLSVASIVQGIVEIENQERRKELIERGILRAQTFSWTATAEATLEVYRSLAEASPDQTSAKGSTP